MLLPHSGRLQAHLCPTLASRPPAVVTHCAAHPVFYLGMNRTVALWPSTTEVAGYFLATHSWRPGPYGVVDLGLSQRATGPWKASKDVPGEGGGGRGGAGREVAGPLREQRGLGGGEGRVGNGGWEGSPGPISPLDPC